VTVVAATKYVSLDDMELLGEAGIPVVGENRAQDLEAKHARYGDAFRWHFIGHLQSRKAKSVNAICELCHSLDSASAAARLTIPALVEVNLSGEESKSGVAPDELPAFLALYSDVRFRDDDVLVFGGETRGLPAAIRDELAPALYRIPITSPHVRSLNLANAVSVVLYEALRQLGAR